MKKLTVSSAFLKNVMLNLVQHLNVALESRNKFGMTILLFCAFVVTLTGCKDAELFKQQLDDLPQISNTQANKYKSAYGIGDTLTITGFLYPEKNLKISVGGVEAPILQPVKQFTEKSPVNDKYTIDRVSVVITRAMGVGADRPVAVTSAGNTVQGAPIEIYDTGGQGSFATPLTLQELVKFNTSRKQNIYLSCVNGKGTIYYFDYVDKNLKRLNKGQTQPEILLTATQLKTDQNGSFTLSKFLAGGVNPQETKAWVSIQTSAATQVSFCEIDLETKALKRLNISTEIAAPYAGNIGEVKMKASGIYPDSKGNVYLWIGPSVSTPQDNTAATRSLAVAKYNSQTQQLEYIFKTYNSSDYTSMPGVSLPIAEDYRTPYNLYISPDEALLYVFYSSAVNYFGVVSAVTAQAVVNLNSKANILTFIPSNFRYDYKSYMGPFEIVKLAGSAFGFLQGGYGYQPDAGINFGFMPMAGMRNIFLFYQTKPTTAPAQNFPKWLVTDFKNKRVYQYHPDIFSLGSYTLTSSSISPDELLNYDEDGHLYMTASQRSVLVKTIAK